MIKLLVVDDDFIFTNMLKETRPPEVFEVFVASSGSEGVKIARQLKPDVVLLELMMPGMSGWEVCRTIRTFSQVPILVLSAVVDSAGVMRALDEGANDYMIKPAPFGVLMTSLQKLAQGAGTKWIDDHSPNLCDR